jgi:uncharacterized protein (DUF1778 family)
MKTLTLRVDDDIYSMIKLASDGAKRNISNFIEYATLQYLTSNQYIENEEMNDILNDKNLIKSLNQGLKEAKDGEYTFV